MISRCRNPKRKETAERKSGIGNCQGRWKRTLRRGGRNTMKGSYRRIILLHSYRMMMLSQKLLLLLQIRNWKNRQMERNRHFLMQRVSVIPMSPLLPQWDRLCRIGMKHGERRKRKADCREKSVNKGCTVKCPGTAIPLQKQKIPLPGNRKKNRSIRPPGSRADCPLRMKPSPVSQWYRVLPARWSAVRLGRYLIPELWQSIPK